MCKMGSSVVRGEAEGIVEFTGVKTFFGKSALLLQGGDELEHSQIILDSITVALRSIRINLSGLGFMYLFPPLRESITFSTLLTCVLVPIVIQILVTIILVLGPKLSKHRAIVSRLAGDRL